MPAYQQEPLSSVASRLVPYLKKKLPTGMLAGMPVWDLSGISSGSQMSRSRNSL